MVGDILNNYINGIAIDNSNVSGVKNKVKSQDAPIQSTANNQNNTLERTPKADTFYSRNKEIIGITGVILAFAATVATTLFILSRGKNTKKLSEFIEFKPAKTIEEAKAFGKDILGIKKYKNVDDIDILNWIHEGLVNVNNTTKGKSVMPTVVKNYDGKKVNGLLAAMSVANPIAGHQLAINMDTFKNIDNLIEFGVKDMMTNPVVHTMFKIHPELEKLCNDYLNKGKNGISFKEKVSIFNSIYSTNDIINRIKKSPFVYLKSILEKRGIKQFTLKTRDGKEITYTLDSLKNLDVKEQKSILGHLVKTYNLKYLVEKINPLKTIYHELGHAQHQYSAGYGKYLQLLKLEEIPKGLVDKSISLDFQNDAAKQRIANTVSEYAATSPAEFVAETFAKAISGEKISEEIQNLYKFYNGPMVEDIFKK